MGKTSGDTSRIGGTSSDRSWGGDNSAPPPAPPSPAPPPVPPETNNGEYLPGSTMYEMGFRTEQEYLDAQRAGVSYGTHEGKLVPEGSKILEGLHGIYEGGRKIDVRVTPADLIQGAAGQQPTSAAIYTRIKQGMYKIPVIAESEKGEQAQKLITPEQAAELGKLTPEQQFYKLQEMGIYPVTWTWTTQGTGENKKSFIVDTEKQKNIADAAALTGLPASLQGTYKQGGMEAVIQVLQNRLRNYSTKNDAGETVYNTISIVKDGALTQPEFDRMFGSGSYRETQNIAQYYTGKVYDYDTKQFVWATEPQKKAREAYYDAIPFVGPPGTPGKMTPEEFNAKRAEAEKWLEQFKLEPNMYNELTGGYTFIYNPETKQYDRYATVQDAPYNWLAAGNDKNADNYLKYLLLSDAEVKKVKDASEASNKLNPFSKPDGYDIAAYLRQNANDTKTLEIAGFTEDDIKDAQLYNRNNYGIGAPDYVDRKAYLAQYFQDRGWGKLPYTGLIAEGVLSNNPKMQARLDEANKAFNQLYTPALSSSEFDKKYFEERGWEWNRSKLIREGASQAELAEYDRRMNEATALYQQKYGTSAVVGSGLGKLGYVIPAARAFNPNVKLADISGLEWAITGAQGALLLSGLGAFGSGVMSHAINIVAGAPFVYNLAANADDMVKNKQYAELALNIGVTALIYAPYIKALAGQIRNAAIGKSGVTTNDFLANEARLAAMRQNVEKYYGRNAVNKLDDVYASQTELLNTVKAQDELAQKALDKLNNARNTLEMENKNLANTAPGSESYAGAQNAVRQAQRAVLKAKNNYDAILESSPDVIKTVETKLGDKWDDFLNVNKGKPGFDDPVTQELYSRQSIIEYTRNLADNLVKGKPEGLNITQLKTDLVRVNKELADLKAQYPNDANKWVGKIGEQIQLEAKILSYQAGNAEAIGKALTKARAELKAEEELLARTAKGSESYPGALNARNIARARVQVLEAKYQQALRGLNVEAEAGEGLSRGSGRVLTRPPSTRPSQIRNASGKLEEKPRPSIGGGSRRAAMSGALVDAISTQVLVDANSPVPLEFDPEKITKIAKEAGIDPKTAEFPSIKTIIEEEYRKAIEAAREGSIKDNKDLKPLLNMKAITDAFNKAAAEAENAAENPAPSPAPAPEPAPEPAPAPAPTPYPPKPPKPKPPKPEPKPIIPPAGDATDKEKREFLKRVDGLVAYRRGELGNKDVWHIRFYPYGDNDRMIILGAPPAGATMATGKGSTDRSATLVKGIPLKRELFENTGAVDDFLIPTKTKKINVKSVVDRAVRHRKMATVRIPKPQSPSKKIGNMFVTKIGKQLAYSRRPLGR